MENKHMKNENAPRAPKAPAKKGVSVPALIIIVVLVIAIGGAAGYFIGKGVFAKPEASGDGGIEITSVEAEAVTPEPDTDIFAQELSGANDEALDALSDDSFVEDTSAVLAGDDFSEGGMDVAEDDQTVVAEYKGGKIYRGEAAEAYDSMLNAAMFAGYSEEELGESLIQSTLEEMVLERVVMEHAEAMGLATLTDEEKTAAEQSATTEFAEMVTFYTDFVREDGMTDQEAESTAEQFLEEFEGITFDAIYKETVNSMIMQKVYDEVTKDVTVTEEQARAAYDDQLALQEATYTESAEEYEMAQQNSEVIVYNREGYRAVKMINIYFDDDTFFYIMELEDELAGLDETADAARIEEINEELAACYTNVESIADAAYAELAAGASFDEVYTKYSGDLEFTDDQLRSTGYYIAADSVTYDEDTIAAAMALKKPGDYSEVILTDMGACIMLYIGDVTPGAVAYESVHDALYTQTLSRAKDAAYNAKCQEWLEEAAPVYYIDRMY